tara:strand:+ start:3870 stop:4115 length:246 start_codon:yes stop_codon:yes gene_type:complete
MIDNINEYEQTKAWLKANQASNYNSVFYDHRHAIIASPATLIVYPLRLSHSVWNIATAMGSCILSMIKKGRRYGESNDFVN